MEAHEWEIRIAVSQEDWVNGLKILDAVYLREGFTAAEDAARTFTRENLDAQGDLIFVASSNGETLGVVFLLSEESKLRQVARPGEAEFRLLAVTEAARGKGIGERLVQECLARARSKRMRGLVLSTQPSQQSAHRLYARLGFVRNPDRDWQTSTGSSRWVYSLDLV